MTAALLTAPMAQGAWVAYGELRGHVMPCGCNPETDLGGIVRLGNALAALRVKDPALLVLDLGNEGDLSGALAKSSTIYAAVARIGPDAILLQDAEQKAGDTLPQLPLVLSNPKPGAIPKARSKTRIELQSAVVYGAVQGKSFSVGIDKAMIARWRKELHGEARRKVMLVAGDDAFVTLIKAAHLFDVIVSGNSTPRDAQPSATERLEPGRLLRVNAVYMVPAFGQGILKEPEPLKLSGSPGDLFGTVGGPFTWLDKAYEGPGPFAEILATYNDGAAQTYRDGIPLRLKGLAETPYAGASACQSCHPAAFAAWQTSQHARGYETLRDKKKAEDGECVTCHVLAFGKPGGFVALEHTPQFAGVQCEQCHGALKAHAANPTIKPVAAPREACVACHHTPHSSNFVFDAYWPKIKHGK